jgi:hypothetical protein
VHDIPYEYGNWDHVAVGPGGVFLLETKDYRAAATVRDDVLHLGNTQIAGRKLRGAAQNLHAQLSERENCRWVQAVVVIWGPFEAARVEHDRVAYLAADQLVDWLSSQLARLNTLEIDELAQAAEALKRDATLHDQDRSVGAQHNSSA